LSCAVTHRVLGAAARRLDLNFLSVLGEVD